MINNAHHVTPEGKFHVPRVKHTMDHFHDRPILPLSHTILLRSIRNILLPRDAMRAKKLMEAIINVFSSPIKLKTLDRMLTLSFTNVFELSKFGKHLILGINGTAP